MLEQTLTLEIEKAFVEVKAVLSREGCRIVSEQTPKQMLLKQGSLWGMSPTAAKKTINVTFTKINGSTNISFTSRLSSDWKNLTLIGSVFSAVLVGVCLWITVDLASFLATQKTGFWSWLITINGSANELVGRSFMNLTLALTAFLSLVIIIEAVDYLYVNRKIDTFAKDIIKKLDTKA